MKKHMLRTCIASIACVATLAAADAAWKWSGAYGDKAISMLIIGDIDIQRRADPTTAFVHIGDTLKTADLVYANLEGMLVKPQGPEVDIPDKRGWRHPGPGRRQALNAWNIKVVGVANNVAYDRDNILQTLSVLDANGIAHTGGGTNITEAHKPAIIERKGVKIGFLQYTARWYQDNEQIATDTEAGVAKISVARRHHDRPGRCRTASETTSAACAARGHRRRVASQPRRRDGHAVRCEAGSGGAPSSGGRRDNTFPSHQKQFAHLALDAGADLVYGHGTHTVQGVEVYKGKPILYAIGHSAFDQPGYEKSKDGLVVHAVIDEQEDRSRVVRAGDARLAQRCHDAGSVGRRRRGAVQCDQRAIGQRAAEDRGAGSRAARRARPRDASTGRGKVGRHVRRHPTRDERRTISPHRAEDGRRDRERTHGAPGLPGERTDIRDNFSGPQIGHGEAHARAAGSLRRRGAGNVRAGQRGVGTPRIDDGPTGFGRRRDARRSHDAGLPEHGRPAPAPQTTRLTRFLDHRNARL